MNYCASVGDGSVGGYLNERAPALRPDAATPTFVPPGPYTSRPMSAVPCAPQGEANCLDFNACPNAYLSRNHRFTTLTRITELIAPFCGCIRGIPSK